MPSGLALTIVGAKCARFNARSKCADVVHVQPAERVSHPSIRWLSPEQPISASVVAALIGSAFDSTTGRTTHIGPSAYALAVALHNATTGRLVREETVVVHNTRDRLSVGLTLRKNATLLRGNTKWMCAQCLKRFGKGGKHAYGTATICRVCYTDRVRSSPRMLVSLAKALTKHAPNPAFCSLLSAIARTTRTQLVLLVAKNSNAALTRLQPTGAITSGNAANSTFDYWDAVLAGKPAAATAMKQYARHTKVSDSSFHTHTSSLTRTGRAPHGHRRFAVNIVQASLALAVQHNAFYFTTNQCGGVHIIGVALAQVASRLRVGALAIHIVAVPTNVVVAAPATDMDVNKTDVPSPHHITNGAICLGKAEFVTWEHLHAASEAGAARVTLVGSLTAARGLASDATHCTAWATGATFSELAYDDYVRSNSHKEKPMVTVDTSLTEPERYAEHEYMLVRADTNRNMGKWNRPHPPLKIIALL